MNQTDFFTELQMSLEMDLIKYKKELERLPDGSLIVQKSTVNGKKYNQWFLQPESKSQSQGELKRRYINKKDIKLAKALARKAYLKRLIKDKENELKCISYYVDHRTSQRHLELLAPGSPYRKLLVREDFDQWEYQPYLKSDKYPNELTIKAPKGEYVRSKSESMIAQVLFENHIPYRYENIHVISGESIATDFTVLHPVTGKIVLWEHFGRTDDPKYQRSIIFKMRLYLNAGYLPGRDLIITFEDSKTPFSYLDVQEVVQKHFLTS